MQESENISQRVIEVIQEKIITGELVKGEKLPPERTLTEQLHVSRSALREALKALELLGLIERKHGGGNYISGDVGKNYYKPLSLAFKLNEGSSQDVLNLRCVLEQFTVSEACKRATARDLDVLLEKSSQMVSATDVSEKARLDRAFHYQIAAIANNLLVIEVLESISYLMDALISSTVRYSFYEEHSIEEIYTEHTTLVELIRKGDAAAASKAMEIHLSKINPAVI